MARPTKYKTRFCGDIIDFFDHPAKLDSGKPVIFPTFQRFARSIGVCVDTLHQWREDHPEFSEAYKAAKEIQEAIWLENAMDGSYSQNFAKFFGINCFDGRYKEKQDVDVKADTTITFKMDTDADADDVTG